MKGYINHKEHAAHRRERYAQEDVNGKLIFTLLDINHTMRGLYEGRGSQKRVLMVLSETGAITQRELTERLGIQPGSVSEVIAKLENAGLVARTPSEADRRTVDLALTEKGREQAEEARSQRIQRHIEMFSVLAEEEKNQLLALLEKVNADWEERYAPGMEHHHGPHHGKEHGSQGEWVEHPHHRHSEDARRYDGQPLHGGEKDRHGCDHDCAKCPQPCGKGRAPREGKL